MDGRTELLQALYQAPFGCGALALIQVGRTEAYLVATVNSLRHIANQGGGGSAASSTLAHAAGPAPHTCRLWRE